MVNSFQAVSKTHAWISKFIVGLNICPFAAKPQNDGLIAFRVYEGKDEEIALQKLAIALEELETKSPKELETSFFIVPNMHSSFESFLDFLELCQMLLIELKLEGIIQLVSFHPQFRFADCPEDDLANFTNRSPFPMVHLLREESVYHAVESHYNTEDIPQRNIELLRAMNLKDVKSYTSK